MSSFECNQDLSSFGIGLGIFLVVGTAVAFIPQVTLNNSKLIFSSLFKKLLL
jgi:hypothetical protein